MSPQTETPRQKTLNRIRVFNKFIFNRLVIAAFGGQRGPFSILIHTGRRTGTSYKTPVLATYVDDAILIPLSYGANVDWLKNVLAAGACDLLNKGEEIHAEDPRVMNAQEALSMLPEGKQQLFALFNLDAFVRLTRSER
jgi:deazaflavin-dependent oxidoreductase (nitroreductase family)